MNFHQSLFRVTPWYASLTASTAIYKVKVELKFFRLEKNATLYGTNDIRIIARMSSPKKVISPNISLQNLDEHWTYNILAPREVMMMIVVVILLLPVTHTRVQIFWRKWNDKFDGFGTNVPKSVGRSIWKLAYGLLFWLVNWCWIAAIYLWNGECLKRLAEF